MRSERQLARGPKAEGGFVLIAVLLVLLALFALSAPFLGTARNASASSEYSANDTRVRLALDGAGKHARVALERSHPALDATPYFDDLTELGVPIEALDGFPDPTDPNGVAWGAEAVDVAGFIDLNSASPQVLANLLGGVARLAKPVNSGDSDIPVTSPDAFPDGSVIAVNGELIRLGAPDEERQLTASQRGLGTVQDDEGNWQTTGPAPPSNHGIGAFVFDQRSYAPSVWRTLGPNNTLQTLDTVEEIRAADDFSLSGSFDDAALRALRRQATVYGSIGAGPTWQRPTRLIVPLEAETSYAMRVNQGRWMAPGSTIRISDGLNTNIRVVTRRGRDGQVFFDRVVDVDFEAFLTEVEVLAKRPVNINTAPPPVLYSLFANLKLTGQNHRIDEAEARALTGVVMASRPFTGLQDYVERFVLPVGGIEALPDSAPRVPDGLDAGAGGVLDDPRDAVALYINSLNANDARLEFATMPVAFTSRQVFSMELRANVSAESGVARDAGVRERLEFVIPQRSELFQMFSRQEDFDEALRLTRAAPYWLTGPETTGRYDSGVTPPSRMVPHMGTLRGQRYIPGVDEPVTDGDGNAVPAERTFASRQDDAFVQLDPIRLGNTQRTAGRILHFDQESRTLEGRYLPDQVIERASNDGVVRFTENLGQQVVEPFTVSMWVRPESAGDGTLFSIGDRTQDSDRVTLGMSGGNLVLRVVDGMGDHRDTAFEEVAEARFPLASGAGVPGLPTGVWSHVDIDVRGNRPDQLGLLVNGNATGVNVLGMTRLTAPLASGGGVIAVESTEGFPPVCALRIGNEIVEATVASGTTFDVSHGTSGENAGFGGRLARVRFDVEGSDTAAPTALAIGAVSGSYANGTPVMHYGYSMPLTSNVPSGGATLPGDLGPFRVGKCVGLANDTTLVPVQAQSLDGPIRVGRGWNSTTTGPLTLALADAAEADTTGQDAMGAFNPTGGFAVLSGWRVGRFNGLDFEPSNGDTVGGVEVIRYSGYNGNQLNVIERGVQLDRFANLEGIESVIGGARGFVFDWEVLIAFEDGQTIDADLILGASTFCYPISIPAPGATNISFLPATDGLSQFAQLTRLDDPELTEWIRYDELNLTASQLVRSEPGALLRVHNILHDLDADEVRTPGPPGTGGGTGTPGTPGGAGTPGTPGIGTSDTSVGSPVGMGQVDGDGSRSGVAAPRAMLAGVAPAIGADWDPNRGADPNGDYPLSRAVSSQLHFRGVLGTNHGDHPAGIQVLPCVQIATSDFDFQRGRPGARDPVFIVDGSLSALGFPLSVHRAHYPADSRMIHTWSAPRGELIATAGASGAQPQAGFSIGGAGYVAFDSSVLTPTSPGAGGSAPANVTDPRYLGRMVKFPSGELPRSGSTIAIGTGAGGVAGFGVPSATVDEVVFGDVLAHAGFGGTSSAAHAAGAGMVLAASATASDQSLSVFPSDVRTPEGTVGSPQTVLSALPPDGGLLRIGEEIVAYRALAGASGVINLAADGRGLLGTLPQAHEITETVHWLEGWEVSSLAGAIGPDDGIIPLASTDGFPTEGTALIGQELIHYTQVFGGALVMPRASSEPGMKDGLGPGAFRGRYGSAPGSYAAGTPVILFPARYWDRYAPRFDGPELGFFGLSVDQPAAWWDGVLWDAQESGFGGADTVVLQRVGDVPWDADPEVEPRLTLMEDGTKDGDLVKIGLQGDRIEWRVFARYAAGAFDPEFGLSHGWKETPRFIRLGVTYTGPGRVLRSMER